MDRYELGVALAMAEIVELRRQANRRRPSSGPGQATTEAAMLLQHHHQPGVFDAGHCRACARQAGLLDHYHRVQQEEATVREAHGWAHAAHRRASVALWSLGAAILLAAIALLTG
jgi:hypothetical protein